MDRPILFSTPLVRSLLAGTKTQTRRTMKPQPGINSAGLLTYERPGVVAQGSLRTIAMCLRIGVGDRLWVRETWRPVHSGDPSLGAQYRADHPDDWRDDIRWKPGIHMFRWASRLTLHVTEVRVQRLQEISETDAQAEGCERPEFRTVVMRPDGGPDYHMPLSYRAAYANLWSTINGSGSWEANPWIAAYTFTVERANIDQARAA